MGLLSVVGHAPIMPERRGEAAIQSMTSNNSMSRATTDSNSTVAGRGSMERKPRAPLQRHRPPRAMDITLILDRRKE